MLNKNLLIGVIAVVILAIVLGGWLYLRAPEPAAVTLPSPNEINQELASVDLAADLDEIVKDDQSLTDLDSFLEEASIGAPLFNVAELNTETQSVDLGSDLNSLTADDQSLNVIDQSFQEF